MKSFFTSINFFVLGIFSRFCYHLLTFSLIFCFSKNSFKNNIRVSNCSDPDQDGHFSVPIWVQTVCIGYQQMTKVAACNEKRKTINVFICIYDVIQGYTLIFLHLFYFIFFFLPRNRMKVLIRTSFWQY